MLVQSSFSRFPGFDACLHELEHVFLTRYLHLLQLWDKKLVIYGLPYWQVIVVLLTV